MDKAKRPLKLKQVNKKVNFVTGHVTWILRFRTFRQTWLHRKSYNM